MQITQKTRLTDCLYEYFLSICLRESDLQFNLREETFQLPLGRMQIAPEQGALMAFLVQLIGAKTYLEIGTFTGYSTLCVALALPEDGSVIACDVNEEYTEIAHRYWKQAGIFNKIDLRLAPALETLDHLILEGRINTFDFAFIDADKVNYNEYYERVLQLVRPGGLIAIDNVFQSGNVANLEKQSPQVLVIRTLNEKLHSDQRVTLCVIPISDGLTLALKR
ncbi:class I SAM-dependent methyltransferase [Nostocaceae cyanobacterium CENA369]|uniref:Class I SAM-dependent methyltransferase n=1 Tax=Dendronalium phyllosphericum CENA369 TaxID=1725256 RepID=A0A8J7IMQ4_9NOST|nr:class I SAM-dependent methyltransferase [Dendronalium phyllosphericum]MBH8576842.1 class I SAM-dependent methyltransferase [Dendronalium phyllosphericum CENA369]